MGMSPTARLEVMRGILHLSLAGSAILAARWRAAGHRTRGLVLLATLAVGCCVQYQIWLRDRHVAGINTYDVYHYYLGTKYAPELGTDLLYVCTLVADGESPHPRLGEVRSVRDLDTYQVVSRWSALGKADRCRQSFAPGRWEQFRHDVAWFTRHMKSEERMGVLADRGTNASPVWRLTGGGLARVVPVEWLPWFVLVDPVLLLGAALLLARAFSAEVALIFVAYMASTFATRWPSVGTVLLRYDWIAACIAALALWRRERPALSGVALAYATGSRIFPVFLFAGVAARGFWRLVRERRLPALETRFAAGFVGAGLLLCGLALADGGMASFGAFKEKMSVHSAARNISTMRVGLPVALAWRGELPSTEAAASAALDQARARAEEQDGLVKGLAVLAGVVVLVAARRRDLGDDDALLLGAALIPLGLQVSYYYYVFLAFPAMIHASGLPRRRAALGLVAVTALGGAASIANGMRVMRWTILTPGSWAVVAYAVGLIAAAAVAPPARTSEP